GVVRADTLRELVGRRCAFTGGTYLVLSPSIRDHVKLLRRQAQIIGPKDAPVLVWNCDLKPGDFVVEVGAGSGAMTLALAHAVGSKGRVVTYDVRADFLEQARRNGAAANLDGPGEFKLGDARAGT